MKETYYKLSGDIYEESETGMCEAVEFEDDHGNDCVTLFSHYEMFDPSLERAELLYKRFVRMPGTGNLVFKSPPFRTKVNGEKFMGADPENIEEFGNLFESDGPGRIKEVFFFFKVLTGQFPGVNISEFHYRTIKTLEGLE